MPGCPFTNKPNVCLLGWTLWGGGGVGCCLQACPWTMKAGPCRSFFCSHETPNILDFCLYQKSLPPYPHPHHRHLSEVMRCSIEISPLRQSVAESPFWFLGIKMVRPFAVRVHVCFSLTVMITVDGTRWSTKLWLCTKKNQQNNNALYLFNFSLNVVFFFF